MGLTQKDAALARTLPRVLGGTGRSGNVALASGVEVLRGRDKVAARHGLLVNLCRKVGRAGAMDALEVSLDKPESRMKIPYLVLVGSPGTTTWDTVTADELDGAVLIYEYKLMGCGTGVFATDNLNGDGTVIAPAYIRWDIAELACQTMLDRGALTVLITLESDAHVPARRAGSASAIQIATRMREVPNALPLRDTLEETLATLGRHTRRNLRYYRRRLEIELGAAFVPSVTMDRAEFLEFNRHSMYPAAKEIAVWRYDAMTRVPSSFCAGVKARDGRWLSLIGGRRREHVTEIDWQMNRAGLPRFSLSTVMRAYILEHEIERRAKELAFVGGTPHSMRHSFANKHAMDIIAQRRSVTASLLQWVLPEKNFLGQALRDKNLHWTDW